MMNPHCITRTVQDGEEVGGKAMTMRTAKGVYAAWAHHRLRFAERVQIEVRSAVPLHLRSGADILEYRNPISMKHSVQCFFSVIISFGGNAR